MTPMPPSCAMAMAMRAFGHGVHRRRHQRDAELDLAGEPGAGVGLVGQHCRRGRHEQDVVEGQRFLNLHANLRKVSKGGPSIMKKAAAGLAALCTLSGGGRKRVVRRRK